MTHARASPSAGLMRRSPVHRRSRLRRPVPRLLLARAFVRSASRSGRTVPIDAWQRLCRWGPEEGAAEFAGYSESVRQPGEGEIAPAPILHDSHGEVDSEGRKQGQERIDGKEVRELDVEHAERQKGSRQQSDASVVQRLGCQEDDEIVAVSARVDSSLPTRFMWP